MEDHFFRFIELRLIDIYGKLRGMTIPLEQPCEDLDAVLNDPVIVKGTNVDGSSLPGFANIENSDLHLTPMRETIREIPDSFPRKASILCSLYNRNNNGVNQSKFLGDSRNLLENTIDKLFADATIKIKPEPEFYLIHRGSDGEIIPYDHGGYIDVSPSDQSNNLMMEFSSVLKDVGMKVHYLHHEVGPGQQEVEIEFDNIIDNADDMVHFKPLMKTLARERGFDITFMPKPFSNVAGSGLHVHFQIWRAGENILAHPEKIGEISEYCRYFIGGILQHAKAISAIANPTINSYKRLVLGFEAPVYITWGYRNRSTMVRVPLFQSKDKAAVEIRTPDFTSNPYLLLVVLLSAGFDGIANKIDPPEPRNDNVYQLTNRELEEQGIDLLPSNLGEAIEALEKDPIILDSLGPHIGPVWLELLRQQWKEYNSIIVTEYELESFFDR